MKLSVLFVIRQVEGLYYIIELRTGDKMNKQGIPDLKSAFFCLDR